MMPMNVNADWGYPAIMHVAPHNFAIHGLDYNTTAKIITLDAGVFNSSWYNIGLGAVEAKFNLSHLPQLEYLSLTWENETITEPIDMLKNYTYIDGTFNMGNETHTDIVDCKYLLIYFYLFPDHTITNEQPMPNFIGAEWDYTDNITAPPPMTLASDFVPASDGNIKIVIPVDGFVPLTTTTNLPTELFILVGALGGLIVAVAIICYLTQNRKVRSAY